MRAVTVRILASDPGTREGAIALLSAYPDIAVLTTRSKTGPDVLCVNPALVSESVVRTLELTPYAAAKCPPRIVVVTEQIGPRQAVAGHRRERGLPARPAPERLRPDRAAAGHATASEAGR